MDCMTAPLNEHSVCALPAYKCKRSRCLATHRVLALFGLKNQTQSNSRQVNPSKASESSQSKSNQAKQDNPRPYASQRPLGATQAKATCNDAFGPHSTMRCVVLRAPADETTFLSLYTRMRRPQIHTQTFACTSANCAPPSSYSTQKQLHDTSGFPSHPRADAASQLPSAGPGFLP